MLLLATGDGGHIEYATSGNPNGEPVLTIHGGRVAASFLPLIDESALSDYYLIRYHRRGYGGSSDPDDPTTKRVVEREARDAVALLRHLGVEKAHVVAHSAGGPIALQIARSEPELIHSIALLEPAVPETIIPDVQERAGLSLGEIAEAAEAQRQGRYRQNPESVDRFFAALYGTEWQAEVPRFIPGAIKQARDDLNSEWLSTAIGWQKPPEGFYSGIEQPTIYFLSASPGVTTANGAEFLQTRLANIAIRRVTDIPNHAFQMRFPVPTAREIAAWLQENPF